MTGVGFDAVAAAMAQERTRRASLVALVTSLIGAMLGKGAPASAGQTTVAVCRGKQAKCRRNAQCCSGRCRKRRGKNGKKKGKCRCSTHQEPCQKDGDCCAIDGNPQVCVGGNCAT